MEADYFHHQQSRFRAPTDDVLKKASCFAFGRRVNKKTKLPSSFGQWYITWRVNNKLQQLHQISLTDLVQRFGPSVVRQRLIDLSENPNVHFARFNGQTSGAIPVNLTPQMKHDLDYLTVGEFVQFKQRNSPTCLTSSLASALHAHGKRIGSKPLVAGAEKIYQLGISSVKSDGPNDLMPQRIGLQLFFTIVNKHARGLIMKKVDVRDPALSDPVMYLRRGSMEHNLVYSIILLTKKGSTEHAIAVQDGKVYDSTFQHPLKLELKALELCCNGEGFQGFQLLYALSPRKK